MSSIDDPNKTFAFPTADESDSPGMSLRDYFAAKAMQELIRADVEIHDEDNGKYAAEMAYHYADAMLNERKKESGK